LLKIRPDLQEKDAGVCPLMEEIFGALGSVSTSEEYEDPKDLLVRVELIQSDKV